MKPFLTLFIILSICAYNASAKTIRSASQVVAFKKLHLCPSTGKAKGACPGWVVDHVIPLACGGKDLPINMQWMTAADAKAKDKWEIKGDASHVACSGVLR